MTQRPQFLSAYALETAPRYTSYPPATRFHGDIGHDHWAEWMSALPYRPTISLYVHIPFCRTMCWYCGCNTSVPNKDERVARYLEALHREVETRAELLPPRAQVRHVHFGGGSPDMLSPQRFSALMARIRSAYSIAPDAEIAVELDPRGVTEELVEAMAKSGVTRASLGVQDLSEEVQALIHRIQPQRVVEEAAQRLRDGGISAINMDVMYGLPAQTIERVQATCRAAASMQPDRVAVFGYAHVPWFKKHQKAIPEDRLPGAQERFEQMLAAADVFAEAGYDAVGFDHFAKPDDPLAIAARTGQLHRNFQGYTDDAYSVLIGLGASAISDAPGGFVQNETDPARYANAIEADLPAIVRGVERSEDDGIVGERIETMMCRFELTLPERTMKWASKRLADVHASGLVCFEGDTIRVTEAGRPYVRNVAARLDPAFTSSEGRHSRAV